MAIKNKDSLGMNHYKDVVNEDGSVRSGFFDDTGKVQTVADEALELSWHEGQAAALAAGEELVDVQRFMDHLPRRVFLPWLQALTEKANQDGDKIPPIKELADNIVKKGVFVFDDIFGNIIPEVQTMCQYFGDERIYVLDKATKGIYYLSSSELRECKVDPDKKPEPIIDLGSVISFEMGTVTTLPAGSEATATLSGTEEKPILNLGIPQGAEGARGKSGVHIGEDEPTDEDAVIWVDPNGSEDDVSKEIPEYWRSALDEGAKAINLAMTTAGYNKSAFLFYSDAHWNYGAQMSPALLKYLYEHTAMTKINFGGDIVNNEGDDYSTMEYLWSWRKMLKDLPNHHSVVGNHDDGNATNNLFSEQYVYGYLLAAEETPDVVRGDSGIYYYIDHSPEKTRYLYLDTAYAGVGSAQHEFVKNALLTTPEGWHIVAIAHIWHDTVYNDDGTTEVGEINASASILLSMFDNYNSRLDDYADCGGWVEFCIGGHTHVDHDSVSGTGIPIILVETDSRHVRSGLGFTHGTTSEASVNGIVADYDNHKIHVIRIGRGESREVEVTNYIVTYTNILALSDIGYQADREISTSNYEERDSSDGYDLTGYIPLTSGDVFRLKNVIMPDGVTTRANKIYLFNADKSWSGSFGCTSDDASGTKFNPVFENGNLVQFTIPTGYTGYYIRINAQQIDATSIITINEPIE